MAASDWFIYPAAIERAWQGEIDLENDVLKVILLDSGHTPAQTTHDDLADVSVDESANYTRPTLGTVTWTRSGLAVTLDAADVEITPSGGNTAAAYAVIYDDTHANDALIAFCNLNGDGSDVTIPDGVPYTLIINASGIFASSAAAAS